MNKEMDMREVLEKVKQGEISVEEAEHYFRKAPFDEMGYAKLDMHRQIRSGFPEVIFCSGKADAHLVPIVKRLYEANGEVFGTRASEHQYQILKEIYPQIQYDPISHILKIENKEKKEGVGLIAVCTAGTADIPVAEEAAQTAEYFGAKVERIYDVGVAGIHRLFARLDAIQDANCVVAVAGMEGALASVLGGLDNTLWGGVIGEDGPEGIVLDSAHEGAIYQDTQKQIKKMQQQGVLLAIASKNNSEDVQSAFRENPHMILKESDFSAIYADWNPKPVNIGKIAEELNLGLDSFVFVDDNEAEREAMRIQQPEVTVVDFPTDLTTLPAVMAEVYENYFFTWHLTDEDKAKTMQYQQERERRKERESAVSYEDYLRSLQTTIRLAPVNDNTRERAVQLMNKTNQFNTCTLRMDELALEHYLGEEGGHLLMAEVSDKYGNSGWVSEFLYHQDGDTAVIDNFLMSCRVMGRKVEDAILDAVLKKLQADGITRATAAYKKTAKNKPVEALWEQLGFTQVSGDEEQKQYERKLTSLPETEQIHTVVWDV